MCAHCLGALFAIAKSPFVKVSTQTEALELPNKRLTRTLQIADDTGSLESKCGRHYQSVDTVVVVYDGVTCKTVENPLSATPRPLDICMQDSRLEGMSEQKSVARESSGLSMKDQETKMCAHIACFCAVPIGEEFCSDSCREAGSDGVEVACECDHPACPVTARQFLPSVAA